MRLLLVGNYGAGNLGDELLREYFRMAFPEVQWTVVSAHPCEGEVPRLPCGIRSLLMTPWWRILHALRRSQGVVFGGGSLFTDTESIKAPFLWFLHAFAAWCFGKPVYLAFQGIGPFRTKVGEWCARWVARRASLLTVRDEESLERTSKWNLNKKFIQSFDPIVSLLEGLGNQSHLCSNNLFIVIPRANSPASFIEHARESGSRFSRAKILLLGMSEEEGKLGRRLQQALRVPSEIIAVRSLPELQKELCEASLVLSQRYHGALAALALGRPVEVLSQKEGDKLSGLARLISERRSREELCALAKSGEQALRQALLTFNKSATIRINGDPLLNAS